MKYVEILDVEQYYKYVPVATENLSNVDLHQWLEITPGRGYTWGGHGVYFYDEKDACWFTLRWGA